MPFCRAACLIASVLCLLAAPSPKQRHLIKCLISLCAAGECKYDFQAWGECDLATGKKNRTGVLKRALMDATCAATVTATKPCGKILKTKLQGRPGRNKSPPGKNVAPRSAHAERRRNSTAASTLC